MGSRKRTKITAIAVLVIVILVFVIICIVGTMLPPGTGVITGKTQHPAWHSQYESCYDMRYCISIWDYNASRGWSWYVNEKLYNQCDIGDVVGLFGVRRNE